MRKTAVWGVMTMCLGACHPGTSTTADGGPIVVGAATETLSLPFAGCAAVDRHASGLPPYRPTRGASGAFVDRDASGLTPSGPTCVLPADGKLRVFVPAPWQLGPIAGGTLDGAPFVLRGDGQRVAVTAQAGATSLTLALQADARRATFTLRLAAPEPSPPAIARAAALEAKDPAGAAHLLETSAAVADAKSRPAILRARALTARRAGDPAAATRFFGQMEAAATEAGRVSDVTRGRVMMGFVAIESRDFGAARAALIVSPAEAPLAETNPEGVVNQTYHEALLARESGDLGTAARRFEDAAQAAARLGVDVFRRFALHELAITRERMGRTDEALAALTALEVEIPAGEAGQCERAELDANVAWTVLAARDRASGPLPDSTPTARERLERFEAALLGPCPGPPLRLANTRVNLALDALQRGDANEASRQLERSRSGPDAPEIAAWRLDLEARVMLARGKAADALSAYARLGRAAAATLATEVEWRAEVGQAEALTRLVKPRRYEARRHLERAETLLTDQSLAVPVDEGRLRFLGDRALSARRLVTLLLAEGKPADAFAAARRARRRALEVSGAAARLQDLPIERRAVWDAAFAEYRRLREALDTDAAGDWRRAEAELDAAAHTRAARLVDVRAALDRALTALAMGPGNGEAPDTLAAPAADETVVLWFPTDTGWVVFAADADGVVARPTSPEASPFAAISDRIAAHRRVRLLPYGPWRDRDLHRDVLAEHPVVYALDLPASPPAATASPHAAHVLVSDTRGDLPAARAEAELVAARLTARGITPIVRFSGPSATRSALLAALPGAAWLHYAGHGVYSGREGWDSALPLAEEGRLTLGDILTLRPAPRQVVLSGCETGRSANEAQAQGLGLAQAFVAAGAESVVAASRPVKDEEARLLVEALYDRTLGGQVVDEALRDAQLAVGRSNPAADWAAFRVWVR